MFATVLIPNINGSAIVEVGKDIYVIPAKGYYNLQDIILDDNEPIKKMPSLMKAIADLVDDTIEFSRMLRFMKDNM
jgi:hypothetical protein